MFMTQNDDEIETLFGKKKKALENPAKTAKKAKKKPLKSVKKTLAERVKKAKASIAKLPQAKSTKASAKKVLKPKKFKPKAYKVSGSFSLGEDGALLKKTKSIYIVAVDKKLITVTLIIKKK